MRILLLAAVTVLATPSRTVAQGGEIFPPGPGFVPGRQGSSNIKVVSHLPLGRAFSPNDIEIEQELSRPYAYVSRMLHPTGFDIINIKDPSKPTVMYSWRIANGELHQGNGAMAPTYLKSKGRYFFVQSVQFGQSGPDSDLGAIVFDVTGLPDTSKVKEVARIRMPTPNGVHEDFSYKHSDGRALLLTTTTTQHAHIYDIDRVVASAGKEGLVGRIPNPDTLAPSRFSGYHDFYVGYDPANKRDVFYGAGFNGYYLWDITRPEEPKLLTSVGGSGIAVAHTFTPDPTGRYVVAEAEYQYAPIRIYDLKPGGDTLARTVMRPVGAWTARWQGLVHNHEVRWPYVFVSGYEDGLQVFNMMDPTNPYTVGFYDTYEGPNQRGYGGAQNPMSGTGVTSGAFGVDVRNADGLIVIGDFHSGFWAFKMEGFDGWNGHQWGMPNISSAQDWDNGPEGAPRPQRVS